MSPPGWRHPAELGHFSPPWGFGSFPHPHTLASLAPSASATQGISALSPRSLQHCAYKAAAPIHGCRWLGTACASPGMGDQPLHCPCPLWAAWSPPQHTTHPGTLQQGCAGILFVLVSCCPYGAMGEMGFWGASPTSCPGNEGNTPLSCTAHGGDASIWGQSPHCSHSLHGSHIPGNMHHGLVPQPKGGFSCPHQPQEHPGCLRPSCSAAVYFPISLHQEYWPARSSWQPHLQWKCIRHLH